MEEEVRLPNDLEVRLMLIQQEHLNKEYDILKGLLIRHETEIAVLWCASIVLTIGLAGLTYHSYMREHKTPEGS